MQNAEVWCKCCPTPWCLGLTPPPQGCKTYGWFARLKMRSPERPMEEFEERGFSPRLILQLWAVGTVWFWGLGMILENVLMSLCTWPVDVWKGSRSAFGRWPYLAASAKARCKGDGGGVDAAMLNPSFWISGTFCSTSTCKDLSSHLRFLG